MAATLRSCPEARGLHFVDDAVEWSGPVDSDAADRLVEWRWPQSAPAVRDGDPRAVDELVRSSVMPLPLLDALAAHCVARDRAGCRSLVTGGAPGDLRWLRALVRALGSELSTAPPAEVSAETLLEATAGLSLSHLRVLDDQTIVALEIPDLFAEPPSAIARLWLIGKSGRQSLELAAPPSLSLSLLTPARADARTIVVAAYDEAAHVVTALVVKDARVARAYRCQLDSQPQQFSTAADGLWLHGERHHVFADASCAVPAGDTPAPLPPRGIARGSDNMEGTVRTLGSWLPVWSRNELQPSRGWISDRFSWINLDENVAPLRFAWDRSLIQLAVGRGALWLSGDDGLYRVEPGAEPRCVLPGRTFGLSIGESIWVTRGQEVLRLDSSTLQPVASWQAQHLVFAVRPVGDGVLAMGSWEWTWFGGDGKILEESVRGRDSSWAATADGNLACSAGEQVIVISADGRTARRNRLPYDGQIVGATRSHFIYGPISGGIARVEPTALYLLDNDGRSCARLPTVRRPGRTFYAGGSTRDNGIISGDALLIVDGGRLLRFSGWPSSDATPRAIVTSERRVERGASSIKGETYNPRDDWPEAGVQIFGEDFLARDGAYGGTTGVSRGAAVEVDGGSVATFVGCKIEAGGVRCQRRSSAIFVGCIFQSADGWEVEAGSLTALVDCQVGDRPVPVVVPPPQAPSAPPIADDFAGGVAAARRQDYDEAERLLKLAVERDASHYDAWYNLGLVHFFRDRFTDAVDCFRRVLAISADNHPAWFQLARALEKLGHSDEALDAYRAAVRTSPNPHNAFHFTGMDFTEKAESAIERLTGRD